MQPRVERNGCAMGNAARFFNRDVLPGVFRVKKRHPHTHSLDRVLKRTDVRDVVCLFIDQGETAYAVC